MNQNQNDITNPISVDIIKERVYAADMRTDRYEQSLLFLRKYLIINSVMISNLKFSNTISEYQLSFLQQ